MAVGNGEKDPELKGSASTTPVFLLSLDVIRSSLWILSLPPNQNKQKQNSTEQTSKILLALSSNSRTGQHPI